MTIEGVIQGSPQGTVGISGLNLYAGPAGATLAVNGTGFQMVGTSFLRSGGGSFTNTGLLLKAATGSNFSGLADVIVRNEGVVEIPSSLALYAGSVLRNEPGGVVRARPAGASRATATGRDGSRTRACSCSTRRASRSASATAASGATPGRSASPALRSVSRRHPRPPGPGSRTLPEGARLTGTGSVSVPGSYQPVGMVSPGTEAAPLARLVHGAYFYPVDVGSRLVIDVDAGGRSDTLDVGSLPAGAARAWRARSSCACGRATCRPSATCSRSSGRRAT